MGSYDDCSMTKHNRTTGLTAKGESRGEVSVALQRKCGLLGCFPQRRLVTVLRSSLTEPPTTERTIVVYPDVLKYAYLVIHKRFNIFWKFFMVLLDESITYVGSNHFMQVQVKSQVRARICKVKSQKSGSKSYESSLQICSLSEKMIFSAKITVTYSELKISTLKKSTLLWDSKTRYLFFKLSENEWSLKLSLSAKQLF